MRRRDREVSDYNEIFEIMKKCDACRIAFFDEKYPYIIPMNFGAVLKENTFRLFFHSATAGTKLELLKKNPFVAFEMDCSHRLLLGEKACDSTMEYESVCGNGVMKVLSGDEKAEALRSIMNQYQSGKAHEFDYNDIMAVEVMELSVDQISGKRLKKKQVTAEQDNEAIATLSSAKKYAAQGKVEEWLQLFLHGAGKNKALASGLLHEKRYYLGTVKMSMVLFDIPEGAPNYLTEENHILWFFQVADEMVKAIKSGWDMPPLVVNYTHGVYEVNDGRHRYEALRKIGANETYAVIWTSSEEEYLELLQEERIKQMRA